METGKIIEELAREHTVEDIVRNIGGKKDEDLKDLVQDIYLDLLRKDAALLNSLKEKGELKFFITKMAKNNICSKNSPFYKNYKRHNELRDENGHIQDNGEVFGDNGR